VTAQQTLGRVGLPMPVAELAARSWDVVVVGGGHNGLTAAAYLARAGRSVLVLEARPRLGGAATLQRPFTDPGYLISPCAYLVGLLHPLVVSELQLRRHGFDVVLLDPSLWCPFPDGSSVAVWSDVDRTAAGIAAVSPSDVAGYLAYEALFERIRRALRTGARDTWVGDSPDRAELAELLADDPEAREVLLDRPIADVVEEHVVDERLRALLHGQGVIGTWAGPRDPGTAGVHAMHATGRCWPPGCRSARSNRGSACGWPAVNWSARRWWCPTPTRSAAPRCAGRTCRSRGGPGSRTGAPPVRS
jgi:phytoene dehydrogenase-like protein